MFKFLFLLLGHVEKMAKFERRFISKFMTSQSGKQTITIHPHYPISDEVKATRQ